MVLLRDGPCINHIVAARRWRDVVSHRSMRAQVTGKLGFYNNWFVTKISWWLDEPRVAQFIGAFDRSNLIFTVRSNDLIFQTAAIKLFMPKERRRRYSDFSYQHHTIRNGSVLYGGLEAGWRDENAQALLAAYASKTTGTHRARDANVTDRVAFNRDGPPDELDDAGLKGAELPRPGARRRPVPADVLRRAAPRRDASASPAAAELHRAVLRAGAADGSRVI